MKKLVKLIKLNNLQYNANRDPNVFRRSVNESFRIQALVDGAGQAKCKITDVAGKVLAEKNIAIPGTFTHEVAFATAGTRIVTLTVEGSGESFSQDLRLDVMEHAWIG